jgi:hypothetical protein
MAPRVRLAICAVAGVMQFSSCGSSSSPAGPEAPAVIVPDQMNTPPWTGGWTVIGGPAAIQRLAQTFTPSKSTLTGIEIDLITANPFQPSAQVTVRVVGGTQTLASTTRTVSTGFDGMLRFDFSSGLSVMPGMPLRLEVTDDSVTVFGWRYGANAYLGGVAFFNGEPWNGGVYDFFFRTYGY